jgi:hypothetical protein
MSPWAKDAEDATNSQSLTNQMLEHKVDLMQRTLGSKPEHLKAEIKAPIVWGAMAAVLEKSESTNEGSQDIPIKQQKEIGTTNGFKKSMASWETNLMVTASTLSTAKTLRDIGLMRCRIPRRSFLWESRRGLCLLQNPWMKNWKRWGMKYAYSIPKNKPHMVKFAGLNLDSLSKAYAWISSHVAIEDIGLVVDLHMVFEHINANLSGGNFLKNF